MNKQELLDNTGYSYSGIADIVHNHEEKDVQCLLEAIEEKYREAKKEQEELEKKLEQAKRQRGMCVSCFVYAHKALKIGAEPLVFEMGNEVVKVVILDEKELKIDHEVFKKSLDVIKMAVKK